MRYKALPPLEELRENIDYNPDTGILTWKKTPVYSIKGKTLGKDQGNGYLQARYRDSFFLCSRLAYYIYHGIDPLEMQVDHINGNRLDNRIKNLRLATHSQNQCNSGLNKLNKSGFKGVCWFQPTKQWKAYIRVQGKQHHLGYFTDKQDAIKARRIAEIKHHGEFRRQDY